MTVFLKLCGLEKCSHPCATVSSVGGYRLPISATFYSVSGMLSVILTLFVVSHLSCAIVWAMAVLCFSRWGSACVFCVEP
jgi:hypothetical protein